MLGPCGPSCATGISWCTGQPSPKRPSGSSALRTRAANAPPGRAPSSRASAPRSAMPPSPREARALSQRGDRTLGRPGDPGDVGADRQPSRRAVQRTVEAGDSAAGQPDAHERAGGGRPGELARRRPHAVVGGLGGQVDEAAQPPHPRGQRRGAPGQAHEHAPVGGEVDRVGLHRPPADARDRGQRLRGVGRGEGDRGGRLGRGQHLQRQLGEHTEASHRADQQLGQVEAGGVLDHAAAGPPHATGAVDEAHAEHEVAHAAVAVGARPGDARGDRAPQRRARGDQRRVEGQVLAMLGQRRGDLGQRRAGACGERQLGRVVVDDPAQTGDVERGHAGRRRAQRRLGGARHRQHAGRGGDGLRQRVDVGDQRQCAHPVSIFPRLARRSGSTAARSPRISSRSGSSNISSR